MTLENALLTALDEVLDKMAFLFLDDALEPEAPLERFQLTVELPFTGGASGTLHVYLTEEAAEQIARNLLGLRDDDELQETSCEDAVREFTNMLMGRTMTLYDPESRFDMDVPNIRRLEEGEALPESELRLEGSLDDEPFLLLVSRGGDRSSKPAA